MLVTSGVVGGEGDSSSVDFSAERPHRVILGHANRGRNGVANTDNRMKQFGPNTWLFFADDTVLDRLFLTKISLLLKN